MVIRDHTLKLQPFLTTPPFLEAEMQLEMLKINHILYALFHLLMVLYGHVNMKFLFFLITEIYKYI